MSPAEAPLPAMPERDCASDSNSAEGGGAATRSALEKMLFFLSLRALRSAFACGSAVRSLFLTYPGLAPGAIICRATSPHDRNTGARRGPRSGALGQPAAGSGALTCASPGFFPIRPASPLPQTALTHLCEGAPPFAPSL